jgi:hypothetical protein
MSAICAQKGGIDIENYSGKFFLADLLEMIVGYGEKVKADVTDLKKELENKKSLLTPTNKPVFEMTLSEFEKVFGIKAGEGK